MTTTILATAIFTFLATQFFTNWYFKKYKKPFNIFRIIGF